MSAPAPMCTCGQLVALYCHDCGRGCCWSCLSPYYLTAHCRPCSERHPYTAELRARAAAKRQLGLTRDAA